MEQHENPTVILVLLLWDFHSFHGEAHAKVTLKVPANEIE